MSKFNIKSYPAVQPTESKKHVIVMSGEKACSVAYHDELELQIKNLRVGKPACSSPPAVTGNKTSHNPVNKPGS